MGEYIATLVIDNEPIELFLWSRPVWMKQTEAGLARVSIPEYYSVNPFSG